MKSNLIQLIKKEIKAQQIKLQMLIKIDTIKLSVSTVTLSVTKLNFYS